MKKFEKGSKYSRKKIRSILEIENSDQLGGIWSTGYVEHDGDFYLFVTLDTPGRTGHDYKNILQEGELHWYLKRNHSIETPTGIKLIVSVN